MAWWGKLLGGTLGFLSAGPLGAIIGFAAGHTVAAGCTRLAATQNAGSEDSLQLQRIFFDALFPALGYVAKADGRVSSREIAVVERIMGRMALGAAQRAAAIQLFNLGKHWDSALDVRLEELRRICRGRRALLRLHMELVLQLAYADRPRDDRVQEAVRHLREQLGIGRFEFASLDTVARAAWAAHAGGADEDFADANSGGAPQDAAVLPLYQAYTVLGILPSASDEDVKVAYRRLMHRHHPDKVAPGGSPVELASAATQRTQRIRSAYDRICRARGVRKRAGGG